MRRRQVGHSGGGAHDPPPKNWENIFRAINHVKFEHFVNF